MRTILLFFFLSVGMAVPALAQNPWSIYKNLKRPPNFVPVQNSAQVRALEQSVRWGQHAQKQVHALRSKSDYKLQESKKYQRQAEYYQKKAEGYRREASYYLEKYKEHQRQTAYYTKRGDTHNAREQERKAKNALNQSNMYLKKMTDANNQAINCLTKAQQMLK